MTNLPIKKCKDRTMIPALPTTLPNIAIYLFFLLYCFFGIAIITDTIMCAIQRITTTMRKIKKEREKTSLVEQGMNTAQRTDEEEFEYVKVWNPTVANLTLMALGSSASEILLSIIEVIGNGFEAGVLGPGTIVGSAAFNLFTISAICVVSNITVFYISAAFSVLAYVWLFFILIISSPNIIEVWEAALTLFFFACLVAIAYAFDVRWCKRKMSAMTSAMVAKSYPSLSPEDHAKILAYRINQANTPHDRIQMTSSWRESRTEQDVVKFMTTFKTISVDGRTKPRIEWDARTYGVQRGDKKIQLKLVRRGTATQPLTAAYQTVNGTAKKDMHYLDKRETVQFEPGERSKAIELQILDNGDWKHDDVFYVHLKIKDKLPEDRTKLGQCDTARVRFVEHTDFPPFPTVEFAKNNYVISENDEWVRIYVRTRSLPIHEQNVIVYETEEETAEAEYDYVSVKNGQLVFEPGEIEKYVDIEIITDNPDQDDETFAVLITKINEEVVSAAAHLRTTITLIASDRAIQNLRNMRTLMRNYLKEMQLPHVTATWKEQIINACSVNGGDTANATLADALKHAFAFPWKVLVAFVPPPELMAGWPCFVTALGLIGSVTAVVGK
ncbi:hypothetical protein PRIPAC_86864 [Pristionchus pacificus]|uniref:Uncharacterized protein n=1 Tax=Pristionchus pacificus TaxID=54126 RepID=A0A2A6BV19_PRIPA|nr:hypothetical protein PRIPAC_86864 [Pristionchus pacificus]|eukprot:PDM69735.1 hypothetical protein PRIPAC_44831 [Pristionchus pacificus]